MEAMKASIKGMSKTVKAVDDKLQKKSETKPLKSSFFDKTPSESLTSSSVTVSCIWVLLNIISSTNIHM